MKKYKFTPNMKEISGMGGGYEEICRQMVIAGAHWLDVNPDADLEFHGYEGVYGVCQADNDNAKALSKFMTAVINDDCTGAQHQAAVSAVLYIKKHGWKRYVRDMTHPRGLVGILEDKLKQQEEDRDMFLTRINKLQNEKDHRGMIIAEQLLRWQKYPVSGNNVQKMFAPSQEAAKLFVGQSLFALLDEAIAKIQVQPLY